MDGDGLTPVHSLGNNSIANKKVSDSQADVEMTKALKPVRMLTSESKMSGTVLTFCSQPSAGGKPAWVSAAT